MIAVLIVRVLWTPQSTRQENQPGKRKEHTAMMSRDSLIWNNHETSASVATPKTSEPFLQGCGSAEQDYDPRKRSGVSTSDLIASTLEDDLLSAEFLSCN